MSDDDVLGRLDELIGTLTESLADLERNEDGGGEDDESMEELAQANRDGDRGQDWKKLQERIDRGETTLEDIFGGVDTSREAQSVSELSRKNLATLSERLEEEAKSDPEAFDPRAEAGQIAQELESRIEQVKRDLGIL